MAEEWSAKQARTAPSPRPAAPCGCTGQIIDIYIPKGNRGFGFARFQTAEMAEDAANLHVEVRRHPLALELAVAERKIFRLEEDDAVGSANGGYGASHAKAGARSRPGPYG